MYRLTLPRPSWTMPVAMMTKRAMSLPYVKMSWTKVAHFTSQQFTKVSTPKYLQEHFINVYIR